MNSARKGPMSRDRPQAAAECSEDRVRTVAKPAALDSGPCALCVGQEVASNAEATRTGRRHPHATPRRPRRRAIEAAAKRASSPVGNRRTPRRAAWPVTAVQARPLGDPRRFPGRRALLRPSRASASRRHRRPRTARWPGTGKMRRAAQRSRPSKTRAVRPSSPLVEIRVDSSLGLRTWYPDAALANTMLDAAIETVADGDAQPIVHSDRGAHYRWSGWLWRIGEAKLIRSMSRKGCSPDNAACEGFFGRLRTKMFYPRDWKATTIE
jgi:transposase InsO family protein